MSKIRMISLLLIAFFTLAGCSGSSDGGASAIYAIKKPNAGGLFVIKLEGSGPATVGPSVDYSTIVPAPESFTFDDTKGSAYDGYNNAIVTVANVDGVKMPVSISTASGKITRFSDYDYTGEEILAIYTTSTAAKLILFKQSDESFRIQTVSLASKNQTDSLPVTVDGGAVAIVGFPKGDNYTYDPVAKKAYFLGDNTTSKHVFVIDTETGVLSALSGELTYDDTYSCMYNGQDHVGIISDAGNNAVELLSISKDNGAVATLHAIDSNPIRNTTDTARFINDYVHASVGNYLYGVATVYSFDYTSSTDHIFRINKTSGAIESADSVSGCYYAVVYAP